MNESIIADVELVCKALASTVRLKILLYLQQHPCSLAKDISIDIKCNIKTLSQHIKKLYQSGLLDRMISGRTIELSLNKKGKQIIEIIQLAQNGNNSDLPADKYPSHLKNKRVNYEIIKNMEINNQDKKG